MSRLRLPTSQDINRIEKSFVLDLKSFTVTDEVSKQIKPVICSICDSIPTKAQWSTFVHINEFIKLCHDGNLRTDDALNLYTAVLRIQNTPKDLLCK